MEESIRVDQKLRTYKAKKASFSFIGITVTDDETVAIPLPNLGRLVLTAAVADPNVANPDKRIFGEPQITFYEGSVADDNIIPDGDNIAKNGYKFWHWTDWGSTDVTNLELSYVSVIINNTGGTKTVIFKTNIRRIII